MRSPLCLSSRFRRNQDPLSLALTLVLLAGCGGGDGIILPNEGEPAAIAVVEGDDQRGLVGEPLANPLVVEVTDTRGRPVSGATVAFEFSSAAAGAAVVPEQKTTDADGRAGTTLVLGTSIGRQTGQARLVQSGTAPILVSFSAMALPENANTMAAVAGQDQTGHVGQELDDRLVVEVTDNFGNPVAGVVINWAATGGGSVSAAEVATDEDGRSRVDRILGPAVGQQTTVASAEGLAGSPVTFTHTALAGDASRLTIISGNDQTAEAGTVLPADLVVQLIDAEGNGVPGTAVSWVVATGGGSAAPEITTTDGEGRTSSRWTLGATLGSQRLDAVVSGVGIATFRATATAATPPSLFIQTQPSGTARNGVPLGRQPVIQLRDSQGNDAPQAGVMITATIGSGGGELGGDRQVATDAAGRATFTNLSISGDPGPRTLIFTATGYAQVTSGEIVLEAIGTSTTITGDSPDPSGVNAPFTVSFLVTSQGPTPTGSVTVSDGAQSCSSPLANGAGSCQLVLSTVGTRTLTATYAGEAGLAGSSDTEPHTVAAAPPPPPAATTTSITSTPNPSVAGSRFTVSFQVASAGGTPTGSVTVSVSGGGPTCTGTLSGGSGSCQLTLNNPGDRTLTATYSGGPGFAQSSGTATHTVVVPANQPPTAEFALTCGELDCQFEDRSGDPDGRIEDRLWNFGDGGTSDRRDPDHEFPSGGTYQVSLTVTDNDGATAVVTKDVTVSQSAASTSTRFEVDNPDPTIPGQPFTVTLSVRSGRGTPEGSATVSDGVDSCAVPIVGGSGSCSLVLNTVGNRTLTATFQGNSSFATSSANESHRVNPAPPPNQPPMAAFTWQCDELDCEFDDESSDADGEIDSRAWTFGDGETSNTRNPDHEYATGGTYTVRLTVTDDDGASAFVEHTVTVAGPPPPPAQTTTTVSSDPDPSEVGATIAVSFTVTSSGAGTPNGSVQVTDQNGGGCSGSAPSGSCTYVPQGLGSRTITAAYGGNSSFQGSSGTDQHMVNSPPPPPNQPPTASFTPTCTDLTCSFNSSGSNDPDGTIESYSWAFGDGSTSSEANPSHPYPAGGSYEVTLVVTDNVGAQSAPFTSSATPADPPAPSPPPSE